MRLYNKVTGKVLETDEKNGKLLLSNKNWVKQDAKVADNKLEAKVLELEAENTSLKEEKAVVEAKVLELEAEVEQLKKPADKK